MEQLEKLEEQQQKLEQLSMQNAGAWLPALAKQRETLAKVRAGLEKHKQAPEAQRIASE